MGILIVAAIILSIISYRVKDKFVKWLIFGISCILLIGYIVQYNAKTKQKMEFLQREIR